MIGFQRFYENNGKKLVICDIQPEYSKSIYFDMKEFAQFAMSYPQVIVLYNGPEFGYGGPASIAKWYNSFGIPKSTLTQWKWFEKNYAWFRDVLDLGCWEQPTMIKIIRFMVKNKKYDWRQLTDQEIQQLKIPDLTRKFMESHQFSIPDLAFKIQGMNGADICGGGFHECLAEVLLLAQALNVHFNVIQQFVYGH